jgi:hypothetical protein
MPLLRLAVYCLGVAYDDARRSSLSLRAFGLAGGLEVFMALAACAEGTHRLPPPLAKARKPKRSDKRAYEEYEFAIRIQPIFQKHLATQLERESRLITYLCPLAAAVLGQASVGQLLTVRSRRRNVSRGQVGSQSAYRQCMNSCVNRSIAFSDLGPWLLGCLTLRGFSASADGRINRRDCAPDLFRDLTADGAGVLFGLVDQRCEGLLASKIRESKCQAERTAAVQRAMKDLRRRQGDGALDIHRRLHAAGDAGQLEWQILEAQRIQLRQHLATLLKGDLRDRRKLLKDLVHQGGSHQHRDHQKSDTAHDGTPTAYQGSERAQRVGEGNDVGGKGGYGQIPRRAEEEGTQIEVELLVQQARAREELAARIYDGWLMSREDEATRALMAREKSERQNQAEIEKARRLRAELDQRKREQEETRTLLEKKSAEVSRKRLKAIQDRVKLEKRMAEEEVANMKTSLADALARIKAKQFEAEMLRKAELQAEKEKVRGQVR